MFLPVLISIHRNKKTRHFFYQVPFSWTSVQQFANVFNFFHIPECSRTLCCCNDWSINPFLKIFCQVCTALLQFVRTFCFRLVHSITCLFGSNLFFCLDSLDLTYNFCVFLCDCVYSSLLLRRRFILNKSVAAETQTLCVYLEYYKIQFFLWYLAKFYNLSSWVNKSSLNFSDWWTG